MNPPRGYTLYTTDGACTLYGVHQLSTIATDGASTGRVFTDGACTVYVVNELRTTAADGASTGRVFAHNRRSLYIVRCTAVTYYCSRWCLYRQGVCTQQTEPVHWTVYSSYVLLQQMVLACRLFAHNIRCLYIGRCTAVTYFCSRWC